MLANNINFRSDKKTILLAPMIYGLSEGNIWVMIFVPYCSLQGSIKCFAKALCYVLLYTLLRQTCDFIQMRPYGSAMVEAIYQLQVFLSTSMLYICIYHNIYCTSTAQPRVLCLCNPSYQSLYSLSICMPCIRGFMFPTIYGYMSSTSYHSLPLNPRNGIWNRYIHKYCGSGWNATIYLLVRICHFQ